MRVYVRIFSSIRGPMFSWEMLNFAYLTSFQKKWHRLASIASDRKSIRYQWKIGFLMIHSTKRDWYLVIWVLEMIKPSGPVNFWWGHWGCRGSEASKITTKFLNAALFWCFENIIKLLCWTLVFSTLSVRGYWGQPMFLFWKMVVVPQN